MRHAHENTTFITISKPAQAAKVDIDSNEKNIMAKGLSLHIGINNVDPNCYPHAHRISLRGCRNDALAMAQIAMRNGFRPMNILLDQWARLATVENYICQAAETLRGGDTFLLTYSGHGTQIARGWIDETPDEGGRLEGAYDEGLVLSDRVLIDDNIFELLQLFAAGTNIIFVCDSCHSCSMYEYITGNKPHIARRIIPHTTHRNGPRPKLMEQHIANVHFKKYRQEYKEIERRYRTHRSQLNAQVVVLSACGDDETAADGTINGRFTTALLEVLAHWGRNGGPFSGSYHDFMETIKHYLEGSSQTPCFTSLGSDTTSKFLQGPPFTLYKDSR